MTGLICVFLIHSGYIILNQLTDVMLFKLYMRESDFCVWGSSDWIRGNSFKLKKDRFRLDVMKTFVIQSVVRHRTSCPEKL